MLDRLIRFSITQRVLVVLAVAGVIVLGIVNFNRLPIDAIPDITNIQVQINTAVTALSPVEVEQRITYPIETAMSGLPRVDQVRSLSRYGLSQVTVIFEEGTDVYFARQLVNERLQEAKESLPAGFGEPALGPIATGLGEIYFWAIEADSTARTEAGEPYTLSDLRTIQEWVVKPQVRTVPGVTEVNSIGGYERQYHVTPDPARLLAHGLSFRDVFEALAENNANAGGGYIERYDEQYLIRSTGLVTGMEEIRDIVVGGEGGAPVRVRDVAEVSIGKDLRTGAAMLDGREAVIGTAIMLMGENSRAVSHRVSARMEEVNRSLPPGVRATTLYDRTNLVDATLETVRRNLLEGALLVILILFLLLGNLRAALIVALAIPLSMLFAVTGMVHGRISGNLMSLGAIDFGLIVDGAVVMTENIVRRLGHRQQRLGRRLLRSERLEEAYDAAREVARPTLFGVGIIMVVYLPILTLSGIEGKMFRPMAETVLLALLGSLIFAFAAVPGLLALVLRGKVAEKENRVMRSAVSLYGPVLDASLRWRWGAVALGGALVLVCGLLASRMGTEFIPSLKEGTITVQPLRIPSISLTKSLEMQAQVDDLLLREFPDEIERTFARIGTAEIATDPAGPDHSDGNLMLRPREQWRRARTQEELAVEVQKALQVLPGQNYEITQPIQLRFNELISGIKSDLAVKVFGDDMDVMRTHAQQIAAILRTLRGASDVRVEQVSGLPVLTIAIDRRAIARHGLNVSDVHAVIETAVGGSTVGQVFEGDRRFDLVVRLPEEIRTDIHALQDLPIPLPPREGNGGGPLLASLTHDWGHSAAYVPLGSLARISIEEGPNQIGRENGKRRVVVTSNVRGRDLGSFVEEAQDRIGQEVALPPGYWMSWGGQFENLISARERLAFVVPLALGLIFLLLFTTFGSVRLALLVFTGVPLALTGGVIALLLRGLPLSITAGVGFIALSGVAVLNGLVMVTFIRKLHLEGMRRDEAVRVGSRTRLRPVLMTALVASLGFVPMALAHGAGAEVQRPLATVVIGGIVSSTFLTLVVLPALYSLFHPTGRETEPREEGMLSSGR